MVPTRLQRSVCGHPAVALNPSAAVRRYLIETVGLALVPGDAFGAPSCLRISYAASLEVLRDAVKRMTAALDRKNFKGSP